MKVSTIAATSIITASTAVSGNAATNLRKLKTATSESGNKFRKLDLKSSTSNLFVAMGPPNNVKRQSLLMITSLRFVSSTRKVVGEL